MFSIGKERKWRTHMKQEITRLREIMKEREVDACLVPSSDYHQSEYVNDYFKSRQFLSGFTGSAGTLVITRERAGLWTDGRYFLQAERELAGSGIELFRMDEKDVETVPEFLEQNLSDGQTLAFDGRLISTSLGKELEKGLSPKRITLKYEEDLPDLAWENRPPLTGRPLFSISDACTGLSAAEKLAIIRRKMQEAGLDLHVLSSLDDIAWVFNLRGSDVRHCPVFFSYLLLTEERALLFLYQEALTPKLRTYLEEQKVEIYDYGQIYEYAYVLSRGRKVLLDPDKVSYYLYRKLSGAEEIHTALNPSAECKSQKTDAEIQCIREAHRKDGAAMIKFLYWLKKNIGTLPMTEISVSEFLEQRRREQEGFLDLSFSTIAGYGPHGAIIHYLASPETDNPLQPEGLLLLDSGGHYRDGSTDITRTIALGPLTQEMKEDYTRVLRCMINLARARFLYGCTGQNLDVLARAPLWDAGLDFNHGTGHGVGFILNVHEGPNNFRWKGKTCVMEPGMVTTDEPGFYVEGSHGIRLENELLCVEYQENAYGRFLEFETLTLCPLEREAILAERLTSEEIDWLNQYHQRVYEALGDRLTDEERDWLQEISQPIT